MQPSKASGAAAAAQWQQPRGREQSYDNVEYDREHPARLLSPSHPTYIPAPSSAVYGTAVPAESKRDKRRRDMVDRVSRLHADTLERRDRVFHDLSEIFARTADELLPPPVFPTFDLSIPVDQLPPSLPFTDPVIPDMHPTPYLFSLHRLSLERSNQLLAIRLFHLHQVNVARKLYSAEVERIEEEYENATKGVVERLLEGVEERRRRLGEEKEGEGISLDTFQDAQSRPHGTRRHRGGPNRVQSSRADSASNHHGTSSGGGGGGASTSSLPLNDQHTLVSLLSLGPGADPFNLAGTLLPSSSNSTSTAGPLLSALGVNSNGHGHGHLTANGVQSMGYGVGKRKPGGARTQPGLPPAHFVATSGTYALFGKSIPGLSALRGEEIDGDLGECRRKRARTAGNGAGRRRAGTDRTQFLG